MTMMKRESFPIAGIYVPVKRRAMLKPQVVAEIAASMLEVGQQTPIMVRQEDGGRLVLVEGLPRPGRVWTGRSNHRHKLSAICRHGQAAAFLPQ
jgi:hypothetical protein